MFVNTDPNDIAENNKYYFSAKIDDSDIVFSVEQKSSIEKKQHGLYSAISLAALEPEIEFIERLFAQELKFGLVKEPLHENTVSLKGLSSKGVGIFVDFPWEKLRSTKRYNEQDIPSGLSWEKIGCQFTLSQMKLEAEELSNLQKGSILLLPESFSQNWKVQIGPENMSHPFQGVLDLDNYLCGIADEKLPSEESEDNGQGDLVSVRVSAKGPILLSPSLLITDNKVKLPEQLMESIWQVESTNGTLGEGELAKIGNGYGLQINLVTN